jgi:ribonuclease R
MADGERFKSFKDLLKNRGDDAPDAPEAPADGTVRIERADDVVEGDAVAELELAGQSDPVARGLVASRPSGAGPMTHGPAPYRDVDSEEMELLASFRVRTVFPPDVLAEVTALPGDPDPADFAGREDLRGHTLFTIDGEDAKDYDDAISIRDLGDGAVEVGVHIADVGHYVRPGTALDAEALTRGTSVYVADQVVPMLPEELSNHLCSLVGGRNRLAYSVFMEFDAKGARRASRVTKSVIRSARRNTYAEVQALLDGEAGLPGDLVALKPDLELFERWTRTQQKLRDAKGSLRINSVERRFRFDAEHEPSEVYEYPKSFSNALIEETALAANQAVGDLFRERGLPTIYRVHPEKDPEEIEGVAALLEKHGIRVPKKDRLTGRDIGRMIQVARRRPNAEALIARIMGLVERATYEVRDAETVAKHFGLAREAYLHFTSPIRRYPDLMVHRWLWAVESRGDAAHAELRAEDMVSELADVAAHCSMQSEIAEMVERAVFDLKVCQFLEPHIGEKVDAKLLRVSPAGLEVLLQPFNVTGFLPSRSLGERVKVEGPTLVVHAGRRARSFSEGHPIAVRIKDVDFVRLQVMLELA